MKFTEEQYQQIIEAWDSKTSYVKATKAVIEKANGFDNRLELNFDEALALANDATREMAHERFVEIDKTKKYLWTTPLVAGIKYALLKKDGKYVLSDMYLTGKGTPLTELEVINIGLKTDWFYKEEV